MADFTNPKAGRIFRAGEPGPKTLFPPPVQAASEARPLFPKVAHEQHIESAFHYVPRPKRAPAMSLDQPSPEELALEEELFARIEQAQKEGFEQGVLEGHTNGFQEGFTKGEKSGRENEHRALVSTLAATAQLGAALETVRKECAAVAREQSIELAFLLAEKILRSQAQNADVLRARLTACLEALEKDDHASIRVEVSSSQLPIFESIAKETAAFNCPLRFEPNPSLANGDLIVHADSLSIEALMKDELAQLQEIFNES